MAPKADSRSQRKADETWNYEWQKRDGWTEQVEGRAESVIGQWMRQCRAETRI
jgi:hypothetical protein